MPLPSPADGIRDKVWQRLVVEELGLMPQPGFAAVTGTRVESYTRLFPHAEAKADLAEVLLATPGAYILKPRYGSNGFGVARVVSHPDGRLAVESDCPLTALYLDEFPTNPGLRGRDLVEALATHRARFIDRATAGVPERTLHLSILEAEIPQHRADGALFEPRVVVQRVKVGAFAVLGAICKRIDTAVGAVVARDFHEEPLDASLARFLRDRVPAGSLAQHIKRTRRELLDASDGFQAALVPLIEASGACVHQFGIDCRLCWNPHTQRAEGAFLEAQFGIGRIEPALGSAAGLAGYKTRGDLNDRFGPEAG